MKLGEVEEPATPDPAAAKALTSLTGALLSEAPAEPASANQQRGGIGIGEVIGQGGTAQIRAGEQYVLARAVAIKELHAEVESRSSRELLLREARVTGLLEHPNIVPIHDVLIDPDGHPRIVMRRISGATWTALLEDAEAARKVAGDVDLLEWHLRILLQVCNAVHFAHSLGILHRDLKPDNVMIGTFGEVYVMDWGLAVTTRPDAGRGIPQAAHQRGRLAGTPAYMAPEMLGDGEPLSERTDVFLLGGLLYVILSGGPPYDGELDDALFAAIRVAGVPMPASAAPELAAVCRRAMAKDPVARYSSAEELRVAVDRYLRHRAAGPLIEQSTTHLGRLIALVSPNSPDEPDRLHVYSLHAQCAFGFEQALRIDPDRSDARAGARATAEAMAGYELDRGAPEAAAVLVAGLDPPPTALNDRIAAQRLALQVEQARVARLRRDRDPNEGRLLRLAIFIVFGLSWTLLPLAGEAVENALFGGPDYRLQIGLDAFFFVTFGVTVLVLKRSLLTTDTNRWLAGSVALVLGCQMALDAGAWGMGISAQEGHTLHLFLWFVASAFTAMVVERRLFIASLSYLLAWAASVLRPDQLYPLITVSSSVLLTVAVWAWGRPKRRA